MTARASRERPEGSPWYTAAEAAEYARTGLNTVGDALRSGELVGHQTGRNGKWIVHRDAIDAWIKGEAYIENIPVTTRRRLGARD